MALPSATCHWTLQRQEPKGPQTGRVKVKERAGGTRGDSVQQAPERVIKARNLPAAQLGKDRVEKGNASQHAVSLGQQMGCFWLVAHYGAPHVKRGRVFSQPLLHLRSDSSAEES